MSYSTCPDPEQLLQQARAGQGAARGQLLELYRHYLTLLARLQLGRRLQSKVDASDLVQEVFLEAHRDFGAFRGGTEKEFLGWLRQILASTLADQVRHYRGTRRRDIRLERELAEHLEQSSQALEQRLAASASSPSQQAARREQAVWLANALEQLPEAYRDVLVLRHLEELSFPQVAARLGRSLDSVKNLWIRALAHLRDRLGGAP
jgi:RNA polymerase sigma-70 factor (ECF subfamily)